ncbi:AAA family ATPase, partial [bacterium]|nr:AAA family ATPase [bacterium]
MGYQALYRTYRPKTFSEVIGQDHIVQTLINSVKQDKVGQAYLFSGPRGTGKTTVARLLARVINCESPDNGEPCGKCDRCHGSEGVTGVIEIDAASHGSVDDMRQLVAQVSQVPLSGGMMVYIIDEVHML